MADEKKIFAKIIFSIFDFFFVSCLPPSSLGIEEVEGEFFGWGSAALCCAVRCLLSRCFVWKGVGGLVMKVKPLQGVSRRAGHLITGVLHLMNSSSCTCRDYKQPFIDGHPSAFATRSHTSQLPPIQTSMRRCARVVMGPIN